MRHQVFVGGLNKDTTECALHEAFARFGAVDSARLMMDRPSGRSRGFGFVTFMDEQAAQRAVDTMDGKLLAGSSLAVTIASIRAERRV